MKKKLFNSKQLKKSLTKKLIGVTMIAALACTSSTTGIKAANVDTERIKSYQNTDYTAMGGMCTGPSGNVAYFVKANNSGKGIIYKVNASTGAIKDTAENKTVGHGNDMTYYNAKLYIANGPADGSTSAYKVHVFNTDLTHYKNYVCDFKAGTIASIGNGYFIIGEKTDLKNTNNAPTVTYHVGYFNDTTGKFVSDSSTQSFTLTFNVSSSNPTNQGICYYNGVLYATIYKYDDNAKHSKIFAFNISFGTNYTSPTATSNSSNTFTINKSSSTFSLYEVESPYIVNGKMYYTGNVSGTNVYDGLFYVTSKSF